MKVVYVGLLYRRTPDGMVLVDESEPHYIKTSVAELKEELKGAECILYAQHARSRMYTLKKYKPNGDMFEHQYAGLYPEDHEQIWSAWKQANPQQIH